ncbi:MAG: 3-oxoacyl-[acyl-carrier-protein] reductase FabG [Chlamydiia bacterium]|nr:3-oxoacyl-[acyl-carrier-protein] reductase FabG [Chlamydiia bacterium]MCH9618006.1 3-oxoacyl-[acyl-carrier-protein] reductase FabG [Chlamydiia bacterium]MCH9623669.1 3-oxoacyl-[acyl-carrier-protein] reductase FabG [Chlamydiia bacterium]
MRRFEGKKVVVTGGTKGIGLAIAKEFLKEGASVAIIGRSPDNGEKALLELSGDVTFYPLDVSDHSAVKAFSEEMIKKWNTIDVLVNNAGISKNTLFLRITEADWDHVVDTNLKSVYNMCHAFSRILIKNRGSRIVNISSIAGGVMGGNPGQAHYSASKGAIVSLTKVLAREFAKREVTVNCVAPGYVETDMVGFMNEENKQKCQDMIPMGRFGQGAEVAAAVLFLASKEASYITGHTLVADGGLTS